MARTKKPEVSPEVAEFVRQWMIDTVAKEKSRAAVGRILDLSRQQVGDIIKTGKGVGSHTAGKVARAMNLAGEADLEEHVRRKSRALPTPSTRVARDDGLLRTAIGDAFTSARWTIADRDAAEAASAALASWAIEGMDLTALARDYLDAAKALREHGENVTPATVNAQLAAMRSRVSPAVEAQLSYDANAAGDAELEALRNPPPKRKR